MTPVPDRRGSAEGGTRGVAPFDFAALPVVSRAEIAARAQVRSARAAFGSGAEIAQALEAIVGAPVTIAVTRALPAVAAPALLAIALTPANDPGRVSVVELEPALAREIVARALKQPLVGIADGARAPPPDVRGACAAVLLAALRASGAPLRLTTEAPSADAVTAYLAIGLAGATFDARVTFSPVLIVPGVPDLDRLGEAPLALQVIATSCLATREEIAALEPGDVFLPPREWLDGPVDLVAPGEERGLSARLAFGSKVVLRTEPSANHPMTTESKAPRSRPHEDVAPLDVALDVPVVVRVEVGSVEMKAREWAALSAGDVISTGVQMGRPIVLRIGGVAVAHGELVNVDGEMGVRIVGTIKR